MVRLAQSIKLGLRLGPACFGSTDSLRHPSRFLRHLPPPQGPKGPTPVVSGPHWAARSEPECHHHDTDWPRHNISCLSARVTVEDCKRSAPSSRGILRTSIHFDRRHQGVGYDAVPMLNPGKFAENLDLELAHFERCNSCRGSDRLWIMRWFLRESRPVGEGHLHATWVRTAPYLASWMPLSQRGEWWRGVVD